MPKPDYPPPPFPKFSLKPELLLLPPILFLLLLFELEKLVFANKLFEDVDGLKDYDY